MNTYRHRARRSMLLGLAVVCAVSLSASAQTRPPSSSPWPKGGPVLPNVRSVSLIPQDFSDCTNTTVKDDPNRTRGGEITLTRRPDGSTHVEVGMTVNKNTTYHLFLKCSRLLGDITTDEEGIGLASFDFLTNSMGNTFAFDMYPEGAPPGNKFQSLTVTF